jgi:hypothetical protein
MDPEAKKEEKQVSLVSRRKQGKPFADQGKWAKI